MRPRRLNLFVIDTSFQFEHLPEEAYQFVAYRKYSAVLLIVVWRYVPAQQVWL